MKIEVYRKASTKETSGRFPLSITKNHSLLPKIREQLKYIYLFYKINL